MLREHLPLIAVTLVVAILIFLLFRQVQALRVDLEAIAGLPDATAAVAEQQATKPASPAQPTQPALAAQPAPPALPAPEERVPAVAEAKRRP